MSLSSSLPRSYSSNSGISTSSSGSDQSSVFSGSCSGWSLGPNILSLLGLHDGVAGSADHCEEDCEQETDDADSNVRHLLVNVTAQPASRVQEPLRQRVEHRHVGVAAEECGDRAAGVALGHASEDQHSYEGAERSEICEGEKNEGPPEQHRGARTGCAQRLDEVREASR